MSFLTPHIAHRKSRSSIEHSQQEESMTSQSVVKSSLLTEDSTIKRMSNPLPSNYILNSVNVSTCSDDSISNSLLDESASTATSDQQSSAISKDYENNVSVHIDNEVQKKTAAGIITMDNRIQKKKIVPAPDRFATKKQKTTETMENVLCQSSHAFNIMATAYLHRATAQQQQQQHPYITAIAEAMKRVSAEQQLTCFMSIMQTISTYSHDN